jgi:S-methylmethionine-dependent homocysteine/selenocysteine methylase
MGREYTGAAGAAAALGRRLAGGPPLLLDGATGTELERRGVRSALPLWSALGLLEAPEVVLAIHRDYVAAGAEALTANTFRTQRRALARGGHGARAAELTRLAVGLARRAADEAGAGRRVFVLGSAPTLEDCYRPDLVPDAAALAREHEEHARNLVAAGADAILVETQNTVREAVAAVRAAREAGAAAWASFVCGEGARLLSGEPLAAALEAVAPLGPLAVGVNCLPPSAVPACLPALRAAGPPFSVYANLGEPDDATGFRRREDCSPAEFAGFARAWVAAGAAAVGGCCGTTPAHLRAVRGVLDATG